MPPTNPPSAKLPLDIAWMMAADREIQAEIDKGLAALVRTQPEDACRCIARILCSVLVSSWSQHVDFQDEALFPIIARSNATTLDMRSLLNRLAREHSEISEHQRDVSQLLHDVVAGRAAIEGTVTLGVSHIIQLRSAHQKAEAALDRLIPDTLAPSESEALERWAASRDTLFLPLHLLRDFCG
jgi:hypothetical protein